MPTRTHNGLYRRCVVVVRSYVIKLERTVYFNKRPARIY
jgi:hypothetical protein